MTQAEFVQWREFYRRYPFDDFHRFHRPAALVAGAFGGGDMTARLEWLQPPVWDGDYSEADMNTFKAFGFKPPKG